MKDIEAPTDISEKGVSLIFPLADRNPGVLTGTVGKSVRDQERIGDSIALARAGADYMVGEKMSAFSGTLTGTIHVSFE